MAPLLAPLHVANNGLSAVVDVDVFDSYFLLAFAAMPIQRLKQCRVSSRKLRCRMHGGPSPGAPKGNRNAFKHGRYTAEAIGNRRKLSAMLIAMKALAGMVCD